MKTLTLFPGREKLALNRHPWVFSGAIARQEGSPAAGELVAVRSAEGKFIAFAQFNPTSKIRLRLLEWNESVEVDETWYRHRLEEAWVLRAPLKERTSAMRVFFSESDGIPGLIADLFGGYLVLQFLTSGADRGKALLTALFSRLIPGLKGIIEKSDGDGRRMEGLPEASGVLWGEAPEGEIEVVEHGAKFLVNPAAQKTGFYTDQRDNRALVAPYFAGRTVLDAFTFTGGFAVHAHKAGATAVSLLDSSAEALEAAQKNLALNGGRAAEVYEGDAFQLLRDLKKQGLHYGAIVLDPPNRRSSWWTAAATWQASAVAAW